MTILRGFIITITSGVAFAIVGGVLGNLIGLYLPDYYRIVFDLPPDSDINPVQAGVGLGATQGLSAGLVVGLVIVVATAWYQSRVVERKT